MPMGILIHEVLDKLKIGGHDMPSL